MAINKFFLKVKRKIIYFIFQYPRILKYRLLSTCSDINGDPYFNTPVLLSGKGRIDFGKNIVLGVRPSPLYYNSYGYIEARTKLSKIKIGNNVIINNSFKIICDKTSISIGDNTLIGLNVQILDSDFHDLHPSRRMDGTAKTAKVTIGRNVFIGSNVTILKGVSIGDNSVIANSSVVIKSVPANVIAGGYPCKLIKENDVI